MKKETTNSKKSRKRWYLPEQVSLINSQFTGEIAVQSLGIVMKKKSILCPDENHNDNHYGNCMYNPKSGKFHCYACGKTFNGIDIVMKTLGCNFRAAIEYAANTLGIALRTEERSEQTLSAPVLNQADAELLEIPRTTERVLLPKNMTSNKGDAEKSGKYLEEEYIPYYAEDEEDIDYHYITCSSVMNPSISLPNEDPIGYVSMVIWRIDSKVQELRDMAIEYLKDGNVELYEDAKELNNHFVKLRKVFYRFYKEHSEEPLYPDHVLAAS